MSESEQVDKQFAAALETISKGGKEGPKLSNAEKLTFYGLFKQATVGKCNTKAPSSLKIVEKAKYDAWKGLGDMSQTDAKKKFLEEFAKKQPKAKL